MRRLLAVGCCLVLFWGCAPKAPVAINEDQAIEKTNMFFQDIMQGNYQKAYDEAMSPGVKFNPASRLEQFSADWNAILEKYGPITRVVFDAYQPVSGRRIMQLYYHVTHQKVVDPISYHFVLEEDKQGKITIFIIDIGNEQSYPADGANPAEKKTKAVKIEIFPEEK